MASLYEKRTPSPGSPSPLTDGIWSVVFLCCVAEPSQMAEVRGKIDAFEGEIAAATAEVRVASGAHLGPADSR